MAYASFTAAKEVRGHQRLALKIATLDPDSNDPTNVTIGDIYLGDTERWQLDTSPVIWVEPLVTDWGTIRQRAEIGGGLGTISDVRIRVRNQKLSAMIPNSDQTFASGSPAHAPEAQGMEQRLLEILQTRIIQEASATLTLYCFHGPDLTAFQSFDLFDSWHCVAAAPDESGAFVDLDFTRSTAGEETIIPRRVITTPPVPSGQGALIPIVYGPNVESVAPLTILDASGGTVHGNQEALIVAGYHDQLLPAIPWDIEADDDEYKLALADLTGLNTGWTTQAGAPSSGPILIFSPDGDFVSIVKQGSATGDTEWIAATTGVHLLVHKYQTAYAFIPCNELYSAYSGIIFNQGWKSAMDRNPNTYWPWVVDDVTFSLGFNIAPVSPLGQILLATDALTAYVIISGTSDTKVATRVRFGLRQIVGGGSWIGGATAYGEIRGAADAQLGGLFTQSERAAVGIDVGYWYQDRPGTPSGPYTVEEPPLSWNWRYSDGSTSSDQLRVWFEVAVAADPGQHMDIVECGVRVTYRAMIVDRATTNALSRLAHQPGGASDRLRQTKAALIRGGISYPPPEIIVAANWVTQETGTGDAVMRDDTSGTITGNVSDPLKGPAEIIDHMLRAWADGLDPATIRTATGQLGSFRDAESDYEDWCTDAGAPGGGTGVNDLQGGYVPRIGSETTVGDLIDRISSQAPILVHRVPQDELICVCYPEAAPGTNPASDFERFYDSGGDQVFFHPAKPLAGASMNGAPYGLSRFRPRLRERVFNRFTFRYRHYGPTGRLEKTIRITEVNDDSNVWSSSTPLADGHPDDLVADIGYNLSTVCASSQARWGAHELPPIELPDVYHHEIATVFAHYMVRRWTNPAMIVDAEAGTEAADLMVGHVVSFQDDCNLLQPRMDYWLEPAKTVGWSPLDFLVLEIDHAPQTKSGEVVTRFTCEQIIYDPQ